MSLDTNDPRLTAYALGELDDAERAQVEAALNDSPQARATVTQIRQTAEMLTQEFATEPVAALTQQQRETINAATRGADGRVGVSAVTKTRAVRRRWVPYAIAASILILVGVPLGSLMLPSLSRARELSPEALASAQTRARDHIGPASEIASPGLLEAVNTVAMPAPQHPPQSSVDTLDEQVVAQLQSLAYWTGDGPGPYSAAAVDAPAERSLWLYCMSNDGRDAYNLSWNVEEATSSLMVCASQEDLAEIAAMVDSIEANPELSQEHIVVRVRDVEGDTRQLLEYLQSKYGDASVWQG